MIPSHNKAEDIHNTAPNNNPTTSRQVSTLVIAQQYYCAALYR
jgi:hypothetical protein